MKLSCFILLVSKCIVLYATSDSTEGLNERMNGFEEEIESTKLPLDVESVDKLVNARNILSNSDDPRFFEEQRINWSVIEKHAHMNITYALAKFSWARLLGNEFVKQNIEYAFNGFKYLAEKGDSDGQLGLGLMYSNGIQVPADQALSNLYFTFSAFGGNELAQMIMGYRHWSGNGTPLSCEKALDYYRRVAKLVVGRKTPISSDGQSLQKIRISNDLDDGGQEKIYQSKGVLKKDVLQYYQVLAEKGDAEAQYTLGLLHYEGSAGVAINLNVAFYYFTHASVSGHVKASAYLGFLYLEGPSMKDEKLAFECFTKSSRHNSAVGLTGLALMYMKGIYVKQDYKEAFKLLHKAVSFGFMDAHLYLGNLYFYGLGTNVDYKAAHKHYSSSGKLLAIYNLAEMYSLGTGVLRSCPMAVELYKNVAEKGDWTKYMMEAHDNFQDEKLLPSLMKYTLLAEMGYEVAQSNAAYILEQIAEHEINNVKSSETQRRAFVQWSRSAHQGQAYSRVKLGDYFYYGQGSELNYELAAYHYRIAGEKQSNAQAMFNLGYMHEHGLGMPSDLHLAKRCYDMAYSMDVGAHAPVNLALIKLFFMFMWEVQNVYLKKLVAFLETSDVPWDLVTSCLLSFLLVILLMRRRLT